MPYRFLILMLLFIGTAIGQPLNRIWTDAEGRNVKAALLEVHFDSVVLLLPDGRKMPYPLAKLSKKDQLFIKESGLVRGKGDSAVVIQDNFNDAWPDSASIRGNPRIETIEENAAAKKFIYESANYRYQSDVALLNTVISQFAVTFEATYEYCRVLPISLNGGIRKNGKFQVILYENEADYYKAGGSQGSSGVFMPRTSIVMVPLTSLGVKKFGSGYTLDRAKTNDVLPHELVHQQTPLAYYGQGADGWFSEGIAEYVAATPYRSGNFSVRSNPGAVTEYATAYGKNDRGGRMLGKDIRIGSLKDFMLQLYESFKASGKGNFNYGCGLLISNYFLHMDGRGDAARIKAFLKAMKEGKRGEAALAVLLDGRSWQQLEAEIAAAFAKEGVTLTF